MLDCLTVCSFDSYRRVRLKLDFCLNRAIYTICTLGSLSKIDFLRTLSDRSIWTAAAACTVLSAKTHVVDYIHLRFTSLLHCCPYLPTILCTQPCRLLESPLLDASWNRSRSAHNRRSGSFPIYAHLQMATAGPLAHAPWHALREKLSTMVGVIASLLATGRIKRQSTRPSQTQWATTIGAQQEHSGSATSVSLLHPSGRTFATILPESKSPWRRTTTEEASARFPTPKP